MQKVPGVLLYKTSRYLGLHYLLLLEMMSRRLQDKLRKNQSNYQRLLKIPIAKNGIIPFDTCKQITEPAVYHINLLKHKLTRYSIFTHTNTDYAMPILEDLGGFNWLFIAPTKVLFWGGYNFSKKRISTSNMWFDYQASKLYKYAEMQEGRHLHSLTKVQEAIYWIGGCGKEFERNFVYDVKSNYWKRIADSPITLGRTVSVLLDPYIYLASVGSSEVYEFDLLLQKFMILALVFKVTNLFNIYGQLYCKNDNQISLLNYDSAKKHMDTKDCDQTLRGEYTKFENTIAFTSDDGKVWKIDFRRKNGCYVGCINNILEP